MAPNREEPRTKLQEEAQILRPALDSLVAACLDVVIPARENDLPLPKWMEGVLEAANSPYKQSKKKKNPGSLSFLPAEPGKDGDHEGGGANGTGGDIGSSNDDLTDHAAGPGSAPICSGNKNQNSTPTSAGSHKSSANLSTLFTRAPTTSADTPRPAKRKFGGTLVSAAQFPRDAASKVTSEAKQDTAAPLGDAFPSNDNADADAPRMQSRQRMITSKTTAPHITVTSPTTETQRYKIASLQTAIDFLAPPRSTTPPMSNHNPVPQRSPSSAVTTKRLKQAFGAELTSKLRLEDEVGGGGYQDQGFENHRDNDVGMEDDGGEMLGHNEREDEVAAPVDAVMKDIDQLPVLKTSARPFQPYPAFDPVFAVHGSQGVDGDGAEYTNTNVESDPVPDGERMNPAWFPSSVDDHFDKPTGALWHRFIIKRYRKCESIAKFSSDGYWYALSCPGCGANCNVKGYYMQSVMTTLKHIREAHPEWRALAEPQTERAFFELMAHDGTPFSREDMWAIEQGDLDWPLEKRKIGDVHPAHTFGKPRGPVGSPGMAGPPGDAVPAVVTGSPAVAALSSGGKRTLPPEASNGTASVANSGKRAVPPKTSRPATSVASNNPKLKLNLKPKAAATKVPQAAGRAPSFMPRPATSNLATRPAATPQASSSAALASNSFDGSSGTRPIFIEDDEASPAGDSTDDENAKADELPAKRTK